MAFGRKGVLVVGLAAACAAAGFSAVFARQVSPTTTARESAAGVYADDVPASGATVEIDLVAAPTELPLIDGRTLRVWAYNNQVPGPTLRARVGDTLRVRFRNDLPQPTTIHWHGIRLPNAMDGVPGVTQPPIPSGGTFTYEFKLKDAGTFWFHPHLRGSEQLERGLYGLLLVDEAGSSPFSREEIWVLDDWQLDQAGQIESAFNTRHDLAHDGRWGNVITVNGVKRPTLPWYRGERVRLRIVNVANARIFAPDFGALPAKVVAFDALPTDEPLPASGLELSPGNRVDLDVEIPADWNGGQSIAVQDRFGRRIESLVEIAVAGSVGATKSVSTPLTNPRLTPDLSYAASIEPTETFRLNARRGGPFGIEWTINGEAMRHEEHAPSGHMAPYRLPVGAWTRLRFINESFRLHPMHIHGQFFRVIERDGRRALELHWRDTVLIHPKETVDVAMFPRDLGAWMLHCHIQEHAESGMMTLVSVEDTDAGTVRPRGAMSQTVAEGQHAH